MSQWFIITIHIIITLISMPENGKENCSYFAGNYLNVQKVISPDFKINKQKKSYNLNNVDLILHCHVFCITKQ